MASQPPKPWWKLHWVTWVVVCLVGLSLLSCQLVETYSATRLNEDEYGWPFVHYTRYSHESSQRSTWRVYKPTSATLVILWDEEPPANEFGLVALLLNIVGSSLVLVSTSWALEWCVRGFKFRPQFQLRTLLGLLFAVAVILSLSVVTEFESLIHYLILGDEMTLHWRIIRLPLVLGVGCTAYVAFVAFLAILHLMHGWARTCLFVAIVAWGVAVATTLLQTVGDVVLAIIVVVAVLCSGVVAFDLLAIVRKRWRWAPRRSWLRFSLRSLLVVTIILSIFLAWMGNMLLRVRHQRNVITSIESAGGTFRYD